MRSGAALVPPPMAAAESCIPLDLQTSGGIVLAAPDLAITEGRQLVGMQDCGASLLHRIWTAPATDVGPVLFAGSVVAPDMHRDEAGDRVTRVFKRSRRRREATSKRRSRDRVPCARPRFDRRLF